MDTENNITLPLSHKRSERYRERHRGVRPLQSLTPNQLPPLVILRAEEYRRQHPDRVFVPHKRKRTADFTVQVDKENPRTHDGNYTTTKSPRIDKSDGKSVTDYSTTKEHHVRRSSLASFRSQGSRQRTHTPSLPPASQSSQQQPQSPPPTPPTPLLPQSPLQQSLSNKSADHHDTTSEKIDIPNDFEYELDFDFGDNDASVHDEQENRRESTPMALKAYDSVHDEQEERSIGMTHQASAPVQQRSTSNKKESVHEEQEEQPIETAHQASAPIQQRSTSNKKESVHEEQEEQPIETAHQASAPIQQRSTSNTSESVHEEQEDRSITRQRESISVHNEEDENNDASENAAMSNELELDFDFGDTGVSVHDEQENRQEPTLVRSKEHDELEHRPIGTILHASAPVQQPNTSNTRTAVHEEHEDRSITRQRESIPIHNDDGDNDTFENVATSSESDIDQREIIKRVLERIAAQKVLLFSANTTDSIEVIKEKLYDAVLETTMRTTKKNAHVPIELVQNTLEMIQTTVANVTNIQDDMLQSHLRRFLNYIVDPLEEHVDNMRSQQKFEARIKRIRSYKKSVRVQTLSEQQQARKIREEIAQVEDARNKIQKEQDSYREIKGFLDALDNVS
ncbi:hypothetical protein K492DRAFT_208047 [Lichtheimia hyalospora FSU 10163]|nr:hypothetical protein K492DRAFT_208047 [Lichtheimia hyalospora FSU 10163]